MDSIRMNGMELPLRPLPEWVVNAAHAIGGNWEPLPHRVRICQERDVETRFMGELTDDWCGQMAEWGITMCSSFFSKGFGPTAEAESDARLKTYVENAHEHGVRLYGYVGDTMIYDTFKNDYPDCDSYYQVDAPGRPIYYGGLQTHRRRGCFSSPGWRKYLKETITRGLTGIGLDGIVFDNIVYWPEPSQCRCSHCQKVFSEFLRAEYPTPAAMRERFGTENVNHAVIPDFNPFQPPWTHEVFDDPLHQEWLRCKMRITADFFREMAAHIKSTKPDAVIVCNCKGVNGANATFLRGAHLPSMIALSDIYSAEEDYNAEYTDDGRLLSKIRTMRLCRVLGRGSAFHSLRHPRGASGHRINLAESLAFTGSGVGYTLNQGYKGKKDGDFSDTVRHYIKFGQQHADKLVRNETRHRVAVWHSVASTAYNCRDPHLAVLAVEQALLLDDILFDPIDDAHFDNLSRWDLLILPGTECMSDAQLAAVREYLESGGKVLAIGAVAVYDEYRRLRPCMGLVDLLGVGGDTDAIADDPYAEEFNDLFGVAPVASGGVPSSANLPATTFRCVGRGEIHYVRDLVLATPRRFDEARPYNVHYEIVDDRYLHAPRNRAEIVRAVERLAGRDISLVAPDWVVVEITHSQLPERRNQMEIHLLNYRLNTAVGQLEATIPLQNGKRVGSIRCVSPDFDGERECAFTQNGDAATFLARNLRTYILVTVTFEK